MTYREKIYIAGKIAGDHEYREKFRRAAQKIERLCEDVSERNEKIVKLKKKNRDLRKEISTLKKELAERKTAGWISVEERLPFAEYGESDNVLAVCAAGIVYMLYYDGGNWCYPAGEPYYPENKESKITHWMPLPKPPKKVKTYKDVFLEAFPAGNIEDVQSRLCINVFFPLFKRQKCVECKDCWNQPYPEEEGGAE